MYYIGIIICGFFYAHLRNSLFLGNRFLCLEKKDHSLRCFMGADADRALILSSMRKDKVQFQGFSHSFRRPLLISFCKRVYWSQRWLIEVCFNWCREWMLLSSLCRLISICSDTGWKWEKETYAQQVASTNLRWWPDYWRLIIYLNWM